MRSFARPGPAVAKVITNETDQTNRWGMVGVKLSSSRADFRVNKKKDAKVVGRLIPFRANKKKDGKNRDMERIYTNREQCTEWLNGVARIVEWTRQCAGSHDLLHRMQTRSLSVQVSALWRSIGSDWVSLPPIYLH